MKIISVIFVFFAAFTTVASAQSISPPTSECYARKCVGSFDITNNGIVPMTVTIDFRSFDVTSKGPINIRPVDPTTHVSLNTMSARLSPKESFTFDYKVTCPDKCALDFAAGMVTGHTNDGIAIEVILNHILYLDSEKHGHGARLRALKAAGYIPQGI